MGQSGSRLPAFDADREDLGASALIDDEDEDDRVVVSQEETGTWSLIQSRSVDDEEITIFEHCSTTAQASNTKEMIANARKRFRVLRHPYLVKMEWEQTEGQGVISIVTEPILPLRQVLQTMDESEVMQGLFEILTALCFLNQVCCQKQISKRGDCVPGVVGKRSI